MANWVFTNRSFTPTATADTTDLADTTHIALQGASATQRAIIHEVYAGGQAGASSPTILQLGRDSQVATGSLTAPSPCQIPSPLNPATAALALPIVGFNTAATLKPRRDVAKSLHNLSFNAFGGIVRLNFPPGQEPILYGNAASFGELSLSAFTGGTVGLMGAHLIFEPL